MFDLLKLIQKKDEFQVALVGAPDNFQDTYNMSFGCESCNNGCWGGCAGNCAGGCSDACRGLCSD